MKHRGPYDTVVLSQKAIRLANWQEQVASQMGFTTPVPFETIDVHPGQSLFFSRALLALTPEELAFLQSEYRRAHADCLADGGDFVPGVVRAALPHLYGAK